MGLWEALLGGTMGARRHERAYRDIATSRQRD